MSLSPPLTATLQRQHYIGRFAPSPTGSLHYGSLLTAVASYLEARSHHGEWHLRIEDLDPPREVPGSADSIRRTLNHFGLVWDGEVIYQSQRHDAYQQALQQLIDAGHCYRCRCSRREIASRAPQLATGDYDNWCRDGSGVSGHAWRLRCEGAITFIDQRQGRCHQQPGAEGDFVIRRADGLFAYQLAVVVDDAASGVTDIVRGADLLPLTGRQILLQHSLGVATPRYLHLPLVVDASGQKLSKQRHAPPLLDTNPVPPLVTILQLLGQRPPATLQRATLATVWDWAHHHWTIETFPTAATLPLLTPKIEVA